MSDDVTVTIPAGAYIAPAGPGMIYPGVVVKDAESRVLSSSPYPIPNLKNIVDSSLFGEVRETPPFWEVRGPSVPPLDSKGSHTPGAVHPTRIHPGPFATSGQNDHITAAVLKHLGLKSMKELLDSLDEEQRQRSWEEPKASDPVSLAMRIFSNEKKCETCAEYFFGTASIKHCKRCYVAAAKSPEDSKETADETWKYPDAW